MSEAPRSEWEGRKEWGAGQSRQLHLLEMVLQGGLYLIASSLVCGELVAAVVEQVRQEELGVGKGRPVLNYLCIETRAPGTGRRSTGPAALSCSNCLSGQMD